MTNPLMNGLYQGSTMCQAHHIKKSKTQSRALLRRSCVPTCTSHIIPLICGHLAPYYVIKIVKFGTWIGADKNVRATHTLDFKIKI